MRIKGYDIKMSVCKVEDFSKTDFTSSYTFTARTDEELSLVCPTDRVPDNATEREDGWRMMRIEGQLDFSLIGILSEIAGILAENKIGIFAVSTYNTDYIFVKEESYEKALWLLETAGWGIAWS